MTPRTVQLMILAIILGAPSRSLTSESDYTAPLETPLAIASWAELDINQVARIEMTKGDSSVLLVRPSKQSPMRPMHSQMFGRLRTRKLY